ncbi:hypothetical protein ACCO45_013939 [Purpureocillium lilacinum]|uniref:Uncharacterized protein n=1 Tax=Purpureocillium lilacinum TaxID=33203 RepID=A0ACC4D7B8_PURLI
MAKALDEHLPNRADYRDRTHKFYTEGEEGGGVAAQAQAPLPAAVEGGFDMEDTPWRRTQLSVCISTIIRIIMKRPTEAGSPDEEGEDWYKLVTLKGELGAFIDAVEKQDREDRETTPLLFRGYACC